MISAIVFDAFGTIVRINQRTNCGFHGHPATHSMNIRPLIPR
ncbi:hypothetical protein [Pseudomonas syringae]|nr:hypothetical protein [Pseudomonas syringae]